MAGKKKKTVFVGLSPKESKLPTGQAGGVRRKKIVFVGLSGGVDSSVSAALLQQAGYDVVGVFIRTWTPEWIECTWKDERRDAMRVAAHLRIPFLECDAEEAYKKGVADYMIDEYKRGRTPNPDVMCNREVKFGVFWRFAKSRGADYIATGHYARISKNCELQTGKDVTKDQSYFLWTLTRDDLAHTLFPVGHLKKTEVRKLAERFGLPTATKKDSQGVCFLGPLDMKDFLSHYVKPKKGTVLNEKGEVVGRHDGAIFLTLGARHGFTITKKGTEDPRYYVVAKDVKKNTITVSSRASTKETYSIILTNIRIENCNWINGEPKIGKQIKAQVRYHGEYLPCTISAIKAATATVAFKKAVLVASGQSIVLYDGDTCLGGGVVK